MPENTNNTGKLRRSNTGAHIAGSSGRFTADNTVVLTRNTGRNTAQTGRFTGSLRTGAVTGKHESQRFTARTPVVKTAKDPAERWLRLRLYGVICAVVALIVCASLFVGSSENREYNSFFVAAEQSYYAGDYDSALSNARRASEIRKEDAATLLMADSYAAQGKYEKALELLRKLDIRSDEVRSRIENAEKLRVESLTQLKCSVAGTEYHINETSMNVSGRLAGNGLIEQVSGLYSLVSLDISGNCIDDIGKLSALGGLTYLNLADNRISDVSALREMNCLRTLILDNNPLCDLDALKSLTGLRSLSIKGIEAEEAKLIELSAALGGCTIFTGSGDTDTVVVIGGRCFNDTVEELDLSGTGISDISALYQCRNLKKLNVSNNNIEDISVLADLCELTELDISCNRIYDLRPIMTLDKLKVINASGNEISSTVPLGYLTGLTGLDISSNPISDFSGLKKLQSVRELNLNNTGLSEEAGEQLKALQGLKKLLVCDNPDYSGELNDSLQSVLYDCYIVHSELVYSTEFGGEVYKQDITELNASNKGISSISPLTKFTSLEFVDLSNNSISDISLLGYLKSKPQSVDLSGNLISDASPVIVLKSVKYLNLANNSIKNVNYLKEMSWLDVLDLTGNNLTDKQIADLRSALPGVEVRFG